MKKISKFEKPEPQFPQRKCQQEASELLQGNTRKLRNGKFQQMCQVERVTIGKI